MADNTLELISTITELNDIHEFINDENLDTALGYVVKLIMNESVPPIHIPRLIVKLQSISVLMGIKATHYATIGRGPAGSEQAHRKNIYMTMNDKLDKLVDALKIYARYGT